MASLFSHAKSFVQRSIWLAPLMGGTLYAAKYLIKARGKRDSLGVANFNGIRFQFRNCDSTALKEVLVDEEYSFLRDFVRSTKPLYVIDVGAHIGTFSMWLKHYNEDTKTLMVEANPASHQLIVFNFSQNFKDESWKVINRAAWKNDQTVNFSNQGDSMGNKVAQNGNISVQGISFDQLVHDALSCFPRIDLMKIDIEGAEQAFFESAGAALDNIERLVIELHPEACDTEYVRKKLVGRYNNITEISGRLNSKPVLYCSN